MREWWPKGFLCDSDVKTHGEIIVGGTSTEDSNMLTTLSHMDSSVEGRHKQERVRR